MAASTTTSETIDILPNTKSVHVRIERTSHKQHLPSWSVRFHAHSKMLDDTQVWLHFVEIQYLRHRTRHTRYNKAWESHEYNSSPRPSPAVCQSPATLHDTATIRRSTFNIGEMNVRTRLFDFARDVERRWMIP